MKQKKRVFEPYGLRARFALSLGVSLLLCGLLFFVLYNAADYYLTNYFERSTFLESHIQKQGESLQEYIDENGISSKDLQQLKKWEYRQPLILLELYSDGKCLYSSFYDVPDQEYRSNETVGDEDHIIPVQLTDMKVQAILYSDFTYQYYVLGTAISAVLALILLIEQELYDFHPRHSHLNEIPDWEHHRRNCKGTFHQSIIQEESRAACIPIFSASEGLCLKWHSH